MHVCCILRHALVLLLLELHASRVVGVIAVAVVLVAMCMVAVVVTTLSNVICPTQQILYIYP